MCTACVAIVNSQPPCAQHMCWLRQIIILYSSLFGKLDVGCYAAMTAGHEQHHSLSKKTPVGENKRGHSFFSTTLPYMAPVHQGEVD